VQHEDARDSMRAEHTSQGSARPNFPRTKPRCLSDSDRSANGNNSRGKLIPAAPRRVNPAASRSERSGGRETKGANENERQRGERCGVVVTKGTRGREVLLPGERVGVGAVEVPELLHLADELAQRGHLPHLRRRRRPPRRGLSNLYPSLLPGSSWGWGLRSGSAPFPPSLNADAVRLTRLNRRRVCARLRLGLYACCVAVGPSRLACWVGFILSVGVGVGVGVGLGVVRFK